MTRQLAKAAKNLRGVDALARDAVDLARAQTTDVPGAETRARLVKELAAEALRAREARGVSTPISQPCSTATLTRPSSRACRGWGSC